MIKLITFDLDNTLWDADPVLVHAEKVLLAWLENNCPALAPRFNGDAVRAFKADIALEHPQLMHQVSALRLEVLRRALVDAGYDLDSANRYAKHGFEVFHAARQKVTLFDEAEALLEALSARYQLAALTNGNADVSIIGLDRFFDFAVTADDIGLQKPHPDMFEAALEKACVEPHEAIHIGDHQEQDIIGAHRAGYHTIWVNFDGAPWDTRISSGYSTVPGEEVSCLSEILSRVGRIEKSLNN